MRKTNLIFVFLSIMLLCLPVNVYAKPTEDSEQLRLQDMLMNMLAPYIQKDLQNYYYPNIIKDF